MFKGSMVALVTPMQADGSLDKSAFADLIEWHIEANTQGLIIAGTTGESATLDPHEQLELVKFAVKQAAGRIPIIAGAGTNSTRTTLKLAENAKQAKADGILIVTPYYNKPTQNGLYLHYQTIANHIDLPLILYNVPGRTGCDLLPDTIYRLSKIKNIIGIKEATGKLERADEIRQQCDKSFKIYSGDDPTALALILDGADGVISVTANVAPKKMYDMCAAALAGNQTLAEKINNELVLLHKCLFIESNPIPTKWVLYTMGKIKSGIRMPLIPLDSKYYQEVKEAMQSAGVK